MVSTLSFLFMQYLYKAEGKITEDRLKFFLYFIIADIENIGSILKLMLM